MAVTAFMSLSLPTVSQTAGPLWASQVNAALTVLDQHTHASGSGAQIGSSGLNINADLPFGGFNATALRAARLVNQGAPLALVTDITELYVSGGNLYYNNAAGQQIQLTAGASLNGTGLGAIGGDYSTSTASVFYTAASQTFTFNQATNSKANLDIGNLILRQPGTASPQGITLQSPAALAASYALTLPAALPASTMMLLLSSTGAISASTTIPALTVTGAATLAGGATLSSGYLSLTAGIAQAIQKSGGGSLTVGTFTLDNLIFATNNTSRWFIDGSGNLQNLGTGTIMALPTPVNTGDAANKGYVDSKATLPVWVGASLINGFTDAGAPYPSPRYRKDYAGNAHVECSINNGSWGAVAFVLPAGYRPFYTLYFTGTSAAGGSADTWKIDSSGNVIPVSGGAGPQTLTASFSADQ